MLDPITEYILEQKVEYDDPQQGKMSALPYVYVTNMLFHRFDELARKSKNDQEAFNQWKKELPSLSVKICKAKKISSQDCMKGVNEAKKYIMSRYKLK
jgi:hypothetical protein